MMVKILSEYKRKARKQHNCNGCECTIEIGWDYYIQNNTDGDTIWTFKMCEKCDYVLNEIIDDPEECDAGGFDDEHQYIPDDIRDDLTGGWPDKDDD